MLSHGGLGGYIGPHDLHRVFPDRPAGAAAAAAAPAKPPQQQQPRSATRNVPMTSILVRLPSYSEAVEDLFAGVVDWPGVPWVGRLDPGGRWPVRMFTCTCWLIGAPPPPYPEGPSPGGALFCLGWPVRRPVRASHCSLSGLAPPLPPQRPPYPRPKTLGRLASPGHMVFHSGIFFPVTPILVRLRHTAK